MCVRVRGGQRRWSGGALVHTGREGSSHELPFQRNLDELGVGRAGVGTVFREGGEVDAEVLG